MRKITQNPDGSSSFVIRADMNPQDFMALLIELFWIQGRRTVFPWINALHFHSEKMEKEAMELTVVN